jgi:Tannase and feruloyl esterase
MDITPRLSLALLAGASLLVIGMGQARAEGEGQEQACTVIGTTTWPDTQITNSEMVPANTEPASARAGAALLPAHCKVRGVIDARPSDIPGNTLGTGFELRLPVEWNGRFFFQGGGGFDGAVAPAVGITVASRTGIGPTALERGFAVASTDAGHESSAVPPSTDTRAALDPQARTDNGYDSVRKVTLLARRILRAFYGEGPRHSYFEGCSNGGRQGLVATQRYAELFDGVVAGNPAFDLTGANIAWDWNTRALLAITPQDASGNPDITQALTDGDLTLLSDAVLRQCDARDGLADGLISDTAHACHFDPGTLQCGPGQISGCLTEPKVEAIRAIYRGPHTSSGRPLYSRWTAGGEAGPTGWRAWIVGEPGTPSSPRQQAFVSGWMRYVAFTPPEPDFDYRQFDFDTDPQRMRESTRIWTANRLNLEAYFARGGKILAYHGMSDPAFSANHFINWYRRLAERFGGFDQLDDAARLFLIPGQNHCGGGQTLDAFDSIGAIVDWVENGVAPERLVATGVAFPGRSRPLCPYPQVARYSGQGSTEDAANFSCVEPDPPADPVQDDADNERMTRTRR